MKSKAVQSEAKPDRRGRPRLGEGRASKVLGIRVTEADFEALNAYAAEQQTTVAELLRPAVAELLEAARGGETGES